MYLKMNALYDNTIRKDYSPVRHIKFTNHIIDNASPSEYAVGGVLPLNLNNKPINHVCCKKALGKWYKHKNAN